LRVLVVAQHPPADAQDQTAVPPHQDREGVLVLLSLEALEQHAVAEALRPLGGAELADVSQDRSESFSGHALHPFRAPCSCNVVAREGPRGLVFFGFSQTRPDGESDALERPEKKGTGPLRLGVLSPFFPAALATPPHLGCYP